MDTMASQITSLAIVYVFSGADQRKHQSFASLAFVWGIHRGPVNFPHKWSVRRKMFPFDDVIIITFWVTIINTAFLPIHCKGVSCEKSVTWHVLMNTPFLVCGHYNDVIMSAMASQVTSLTIVYSTVYQAQMRDNTKAPCHWPLCGEFTGDQWIPRTNGQ